MAPNEIVGAVVDSGGFQHGHTYAANPLSCAVGEAVIGELIEKDLMNNATEMGGYLTARLKDLANSSQVIGDIRGKGLLLAAEIVANKDTKEMLPVECRAVYRLVEIGIENGLLLYTRKTSGGVFGEWVMITPALTIDKSEVDELIDLLRITFLQFEQELHSLKYI